MDRLLYVLLVVVVVFFFWTIVMRAGSCRREMQGGDNLVRPASVQGPRRRCRLRNEEIGDGIKEYSSLRSAADVRI